MQLDFSKWGPITILMVALVLLMAVGGLVIVVAEPSTLSFHDYLNEMEKSLFALGGLAVSHGLIHIGNAVKS